MANGVENSVGGVNQGWFSKKSSLFSLSKSKDFDFICFLLFETAKKVLVRHRSRETDSLRAKKKSLPHVCECVCACVRACEFVCLFNFRVRESSALALVEQEREKKTLNLSEVIFYQGARN